VRVETEFSSEPLRIIGDSTQLQQVVLNVVLNGVDAMEAKDKEDRRLSIRTLAADLHAVVEVADSGVGLRSGQEGKIFEAFFSTKSKGIGMGLAICRSIIEAHGGKIWANANRPSGSIFSFSVPLQQRVDVIV
jgi:signal transduction histidine kinase